MVYQEIGKHIYKCWPVNAGSGPESPDYYDIMSIVLRSMSWTWLVQ
jgi:hypothetical protein